MLPKGKLITEKNKVNGDKVYTSTDEKHFDKPVAVLINGEVPVLRKFLPAVCKTGKRLR